METSDSGVISFATIIILSALNESLGKGVCITPRNALQTCACTRFQYTLEPLTAVAKNLNCSGSRVADYVQDYRGSILVKGRILHFPRTTTRLF
jgi:hypothetical protein